MQNVRNNVRGKGYFGEAVHSLQFAIDGEVL